jgi:hypothetical protein
VNSLHQAPAIPVDGGGISGNSAHTLATLTMPIHRAAARLTVCGFTVW